jgi:hypothetical protein
MSYLAEPEELFPVCPECLGVDITDAQGYEPDVGDLGTCEDRQHEFTVMQKDLMTISERSMMAFG